MSEFQTRVPPDLAQLASLRHSLSDWLQGAGVPEPPRDNVVLATHEATANAIEHAQTSEPVVIWAEVSDAAVTIEVRDHGQWKATGEFNEDRGRGLPLIAALVSVVEIEASPDGTTLRLVHPA